MKEIMATDLVRAKTVSNQCKLSFPAAVHTFSPYRGVFDGAFPLTVSRVLRAAKYTNIYIQIRVFRAEILARNSYA